jgi:EmrB/QacA subfamily drug resistance transporter
MANIFKPPCDEASIQSVSTAAPCVPTAEVWILAATILASSMAFIDGTVVNVALPALQRSLGATALDVQWIVESYALSLAALLLVGGSAGDRFGRRLIFCSGVALFALASVACAASSTVGRLIAARTVQGVGAALLIPGSLAILSASFAEERRDRAIATWSGFTSITAAVGPLVGGWLIEHFSWRAVFLINLPLAAAVLLISLRWIPESRDGERKASLDSLGACLATLGLAALVYGLIESSRSGFNDRLVVVAITGGVLLLGMFLVVEARSSEPMLPLALFQSRSFGGANLVTFLLYAALGGGMFFVPLNLIQVQGYSATAAGAALLPFILIVFLLSRWSGTLVKRHGAKLPLVFGPLVAALGFGLFVTPDVGGSYWTTFFPAVAALGFGMALTIAPLTATVMGTVARNRAGIASGVNNAVSRTAGLFGIAILGIAILHSSSKELNRRLSGMDLSPAIRGAVELQTIRLAGADLPADIDEKTRAALSHAVAESFVVGFRTVMTAAAALALASALTALMMIDGSSASTSAPVAPLAAITPRPPAHPS